MRGDNGVRLPFSSAAPQHRRDPPLGAEAGAAGPGVGEAGSPLAGRAGGGAGRAGRREAGRRGAGGERARAGRRGGCWRRRRRRGRRRRYRRSVGRAPGGRCRRGEVPEAVTAGDGRAPAGGDACVAAGTLRPAVGGGVSLGVVGKEGGKEHPAGRVAITPSAPRSQARPERARAAPDDHADSERGHPDIPLGLA